MDADLEPGEDTVGRLLMAAVALARTVDVDPEAALRRAADSLRDRAQALEVPDPPGSS